MTLLGEIGLACGMCCVGALVLTKLKRRPKGRWLLPQSGQAKRWCLPLSTRSFIVRCWTEQASAAKPGMLRYSLEDAATGERSGYRTTDQLLQALARQLHTATRAWAQPDAVLSVEAA
jgi:hypothetical protein